MEHQWPLRNNCYHSNNGKTLVSGIENDYGYTTTTLTSALSLAYDYHVFYQQKDLPLFPPGYTPGPVPVASTSSQQITGLPEPTATQPSSGLSLGAKAGIGIGVGLGVLLFALGILFIIWKRRSFYAKEIPHPGGPELHDEDIKEISGLEVERCEPISAELATFEPISGPLTSKDEKKRRTKRRER